MKEDKFDKIIRDKLYNHQLPVPDKLWEQLEEQLQSPPLHKVPLFRQYRNIAAIAVSILSAGLISVYLANNLNQTDTPVAISNTDLKVLPVKTPVAEITKQLSQVNTESSSDKYLSKTSKNSFVSTPKKTLKASSSSKLPVSTDTENKWNNEEEKETILKKEQTNIENRPSDYDEKVKAFMADGQKAQNPVAETNKSDKSKNKDLQLAVNFGNSGFANALQKQPYATLRTKIDKNMVQFAQDMHPSSMGSQTNVKHHTPLSVGIMLSKELPHRFSIETGVRYTFMHSELKNPEATRKESQQLHYLGIPLYAKYRFWEWRNFSAYGKIGGAVDFNIAGSWKELYNYQADFGAGQVSIFNEEIERRPQFSVGGTLGIAYSLSDLFQLYFEPGVAYYFDNFTGVRNIRKEKPLDLSLQVGGRFSF